MAKSTKYCQELGAIGTPGCCCWECEILQLFGKSLDTQKVNHMFTV